MNDRIKMFKKLYRLKISTPPMLIRDPIASFSSIAA